MSEKSENAKALKTVETLTHEEASRRNIPTAEYQSLVNDDLKHPLGSPMNGEIAISTPSWYGAARTSRIGPIW